MEAMNGSETGHHSNPRLLDTNLKQALRCFRRKEFGKSCAYFCIAFNFSLSEDTHEFVFNKYKGTFLYSLSNYTALLEEKRDYDGVVNAFKQCLESYPLCEDVYFLLASFYCRRLKFCEATVNLLHALKINPNYNLAHICLENIKSSSIKRWHFSMMNDTLRNSAFKNAIQKAIEAGNDTILDIGTGCGLLSYFAHKCGAKEVYGCEVNDLIFHICKDILNANGLDDKISVVNKMSTDLVVGIDIPQNLNWKEFGNIKIPEDLFVCENSQDLKYSTENFSKITDLCYLSEPFKIIEVDFNNASQLEEMLNPCFQIIVSVKANTSGRFDFIGIWFDLILNDGMKVSTCPNSSSTAWEQAVYYLPFSQQLNSDEIVQIRATFCKDAMDLKILRENLIPKCISMSDESIRYLNGTKYTSFILNACSSIVTFNHSLRILDFCYFPLVGLHFTTLSNVDQVFIVTECEQVKDEMKEFINGISTIVKEKIQIKEYEDILNVETKKWDLIIMDFVEPSGLLRSNLLERIYYLKVAVLSDVNVRIFPERIKVMGMVVQSNDLVKRSRLVSDDHVDGLKASEFINILETEILQEISLSKFDYAALTDHFELLTINLIEDIQPSDNITEPSKESSVCVIGSGEVHAIIFWYMIGASVDDSSCDMQSVFNTRHENNWNLSAFIVKSPFSVKKGENLNINTTFCQGFLRVKINQT
ncbi:putative protein arginine N-methyltransferase 9-like protein [Dinothrombium tinctorium]|uniref:Protein arginine N-methyltransferase domain-containing protein n=1 Tax=Dinothrombium tinctorium TaxID=1965070 RepID=A0A443RN75_9ACAR|nr:putative protein arginine N-methyltransferase 9-like protein [Dinothrombium tinctorium]